MLSNRKNGHVEIELDGAEKKRDKIGEKRQKSGSLEALFSTGIDDEGVIDYDINDSKL